MLFLQRLRELEATLTTDSYLVLVTCDLDDESMTSEIIRTAASHRNVLVDRNESESKVHAINRGMDLAGDFDILLCMSDDMHPVAMAWNEILDKRVTETWGESLDWFAHFSDGFTDLSTMSIMGRTYFERTGTIYDPSYRSESCDAEAMYVAMMLGRYARFDEVLFRHEHPKNGFHGLSDATYLRNARHGTEDAQIYFTRMQTYFGVSEEERVQPLPLNPVDYLEWIK